jgi:hypothetical protein
MERQKEVGSHMNTTFGRGLFLDVKIPTSKPTLVMVGVESVCVNGGDDPSRFLFRTWEGVPMDLQLNESSFTWGIVQRIVGGLRTENKITTGETTGC